MLILDFYFLGLTYIIVYVGAIMILFLFVIMMVQITEVSDTSSITPIQFSLLSPYTMIYTNNNLSSQSCYLNNVLSTNTDTNLLTTSDLS